MKKYLKFRKSYGDYIKGMNDKQAGQFIKAISGYAFEGKAYESNDAKVMAAYVYAKTMIDISNRDSENGKKGHYIMMENKRKRRTMDEFGMVLGAIALAKSSDNKSASGKGGK